jgi:hypothetical protein
MRKVACFVVTLPETTRLGERAAASSPNCGWHADWLLDVVLEMRHGFYHLPQERLD